MTTGQARNDLFAAFREDHAILGGGFSELSQGLRAGDVGAARAVARRLDEEAGAHIAFEEEDFYPRLGSLIGEDEKQRMYAEHRLGLDVVQALTALPEDAALADGEMLDLLGRSEAMEQHIADCGELFEAMGRIPPDEQTELHRRLVEWRRRRPRWSSFAAGDTSSPASSSE